ncbi:MAG: hypothetical protein J6Y21_03945 [Clostridia bacterium]|nr:hypothetical protein [Clostridia bacterium]
MSTANKNFGLKLIALTLVVTIFATLLPSQMVFWAEDSIVPQVISPSNDPDDFTVDLTDEPVSNNIVDALFEDSYLRTPNSKTLRQNDGTYKLGTYNFEVHFPTSEGYVEYDNTLIHKAVSYNGISGPY